MSSISKLELTQKKHESYLQTIGENLFAHQTSMKAVNSAMDDMRSKVEKLNTVNSGLGGNENSASKGNVIKMDATTTTDAIFKLQTKVDRLTEKVRDQSNGSVKFDSDTSSTADYIKTLVVQMDELRENIKTVELALVRHQGRIVAESRLTLGVQRMQSKMQRIMDEISLAHKLRLETMFYQLTKEYEGRCAPEDIEFGLQEDQLFMVRQRILERLSVEDGVQCEFVRLKESQQMYS